MQNEQEPFGEVNEMKQKNANWARVVAAGVLAGLGLSAEASLVVPAGNSLVVNDTDLNVTWTQDANLFKTMYDANPNLVSAIAGVMPTYNDPSWGLQTIADSPVNDGYDDFNTTTGQMSWWGGQAWVAYLNHITYAGQTGWRLPNADPACGFNYNCSGSELGHLFYSELGGLASQSITTTHDGDYNLFSNVQSSVYWSGTEYAPFPLYAWRFNTLSGYQNFDFKYNTFYGWAVRPGQVAAVPVPAAVWLMGSGLVGLLGWGRRKAGTWVLG